MTFNRKDLLGLEDLKSSEILALIENAESLKEISQRDIKKVPTLRGKTVICFFHEPSTRTRTSFEIAGKRMSADTVNISASGSSLVKGETLKDMARNLEAMAPDVIIIRHSVPGTPHLLAHTLKTSIVNAGDGAHEHPTQALLDLMTIREHKGKFEGLNVLLVGDITHSRVARSNIYGMTTMGMNITVAGPPTTIPPFIERLGVKVVHRYDHLIPECDVIMMLRVQKERFHRPLFPSMREYSKLFGLNLKRLQKAREDVLIMHPGPINRGIELDPAVADGPFSVILEQVTNGVAIRMAILYLLCRGISEK
ncbi:aspartate carbamoyltransferase catalytic subunit [candidate division CSSED10-310 bacterium]|uniref:Aspartate carbamoyltransferase n=1 Tax=candidate division CSSED10-310 bacterium TaxID=2855610 RepID=A0ABV6Z4L2_UNCC1